MRNERDEALQLWNSSVEERKKLHQEMALMIQARDASLRKAFMHQEEINQLKAECDTWRRQASRRTDTMCHGCTQRRDLVLPQKSMRHDSGFSAGSAGSSGMHVEEVSAYEQSQIFNLRTNLGYFEIVFELVHVRSEQFSLGQYCKFSRSIQGHFAF